MTQSFTALNLAASVAAVILLASQSQGAEQTKYEKRLEACRIQAGDVQAEPALEDGKLIGFRYTQIRAGSAYSRAGFKPGDILIEQNGVQLREPDDIRVAFETAKEGEPQVSTVLRAGKPIKFKMACSKKAK